eukprot:COSAG05_NODE_7123_length_853_cov_1.655172_1_plen_183_part_10
MADGYQEKWGRPERMAGTSQIQNWRYPCYRAILRRGRHTKKIRGLVATTCRSIAARSDVCRVGVANMVGRLSTFVVCASRFRVRPYRSRCTGRRRVAATGLQFPRYIDSIHLYNSSSLSSITRIHVPSLIGSPQPCRTHTPHTPHTHSCITTQQGHRHRQTHPTSLYRHTRYRTRVTMKRSWR